MKNITRTYYLEKIKPFVGQDLIKVIVGQRRVGKSYFLLQIIDYLKTQKIAKKQIIYLNKELEEYQEVSDYRDLLQVVHKKEKSQKADLKQKRYVVVDEVQEIEQFEKAVRSLHASGNYDIYLTGSNSDLLSQDLATMLAARYVEIKIFSLSYREFLKFHDKKDTKESFVQYLEFGSMPYLHNLELTQGVVYEYLQAVYSTVLLKDITKRYNLRNVSFLENLVYFLAEHTGCLISAKKISDYLQSQNIAISPRVVGNYLKHVSSSLLVYAVNRAEVLGKKVFETRQKYYFEDTGIRNTIVGFCEVDMPNILENVVFAHLLKAGFVVRVGQLSGNGRTREVDFVAVKNQQVIYIQVAYLIKSKKTLDREVGNLLAIKDNYRKVLLSFEPVATANYSGVEHMGIREFLGEWEV